MEDGPKEVRDAGNDGNKERRDETMAAATA